MTKNTWIAVPAGALGQGNANARPSGAHLVRAAAQPPFAGRQGSGLPSARLRDIGDVPVVGQTVVRQTVVGRTVVAIAPTGNAPCTPRGEFIAQHDGTTLGFHPSRRPLS